MKVKRIYPGSLNGLINYIEENFQEIDQYVVTFHLKEGSTLTVYDSYSYLEAVGLAGIALDTIHHSAHEGEFEPKER